MCNFVKKVNWCFGGTRCLHPQVLWESRAGSREHAKHCEAIRAPPKRRLTFTRPQSVDILDDRNVLYKSLLLPKDIIFPSSGQWSQGVQECSLFWCPRGQRTTTFIKALVFCTWHPFLVLSNKQRAEHGYTSVCDWVLSRHNCYKYKRQIQFMLHFTHVIPQAS
jgi:hypothetical protein